MSEATPPPPTTPKTVSDKKRFFENVMEDQQKPTPKSGKIFLKIFQVKKVENFCAKKDGSSTSTYAFPAPFYHFENRESFVDFSVDIFFTIFVYGGNYFMKFCTCLTFT